MAYLPPDLCLSEEDFTGLVLAGRTKLHGIRDSYVGASFETDLSEGSGLPSEKIAAVLTMDVDGLQNCLTGLEWERLFSAAHIYPEDLLQEAGLDPQKLVAHPKSSFMVAHHGNAPDETSDRRISALFDVMSDFFLLATSKVAAQHGTAS